MKKKIYSGAFALALLVAATVGVQESKKNDVLLNDLALVNIEALAFTEVPGIGVPGKGYEAVYIFEVKTETKCENGTAYKITLTDSDCYRDGRINCPGPQVSLEKTGYCI